jgi:hypothetical protein
MSGGEEVQPTNPRDEARINIHGVVRCVEGGDVSVGNPKGLHYVWKPDGEARWRDLHKLLHKLAGDHKIDDRAGLEDAVDAAALIYRGLSALPKHDVERLFESIPKVTEALREENDGRIAGLLTDRDRRLIDGRTWKPSRHIDRFLRLDSGLLLNPGFPRTALHRWMNRRRGLFDGWEASYERQLAIRMRLSRIRADLTELSRALKAAVPETRTADVKLHGAVAELNRRWKSLRGKKVSRTNFVESVIAFIDPDAAAKVPSAMRHRLKGVAK